MLLRRELLLVTLSFEELYRKTVSVESSKGILTKRSDQMQECRAAAVLRLSSYVLTVLALFAVLFLFPFFVF